MRVLSEEARANFASEVVGTIWRFKSTDSPVELQGHTEKQYQDVLSQDSDDLNGSVTQNILIAILHDDKSMIKFLNYLDQVFKDSEFVDEIQGTKLLNSIDKAMDLLESYARIIYKITDYSINSALGFIEANSEFGDVVADGLRKKLGLELNEKPKLKIHTEDEES